MSWFDLGITTTSESIELREIMEGKSDFVSIPIRFIKTKECHYEKHKENIDKIMLKYISDQIRRDSVEVRRNT